MVVSLVLMLVVCLGCLFVLHGFCVSIFLCLFVDVWCWCVLIFLGEADRPSPF